MKHYLRRCARYYWRLAGGTGSSISTWTARAQSATGILVWLWPVGSTWYGFSMLGFLPEPWRFWTPWLASAALCTGIFLLANFDHVDALQQSAVSKIEVISRPEEPYVMDFQGNGGRVLLHRVGIRNSSMLVPLSDVQVACVEIVGVRTGILPVRLHQKDDNTMPFKETFSLSPGAEQLVDVIQDQPAQTNPRVPPDRQLTIQSISPGVGITEPSPAHRLRLLVTARETAPLNLLFEVRRNTSGQIEFRRI